MEKHSEDSQQLETKWISPEDFQFLCFNAAREFLTFKEPIPDYSTRDIALLESSLNLPRQTFGGKLLYPTLIKQATILFYTLIKNHPFKNGNKRISVMTLLAFLSLNNKWLQISSIGLYKLAYLISGSKPNERDIVLMKTEEMLGEFLVDAAQ